MAEGLWKEWLSGTLEVIGKQDMPASEKKRMRWQAMELSLKAFGFHHGCEETIDQAERIREVVEERVGKEFETAGAAARSVKPLFSQGLALRVGRAVKARNRVAHPIAFDKSLIADVDKELKNKPGGHVDQSGVVHDQGGQKDEQRAPPKLERRASVGDSAFSAAEPEPPPQSGVEPVLPPRLAFLEKEVDHVEEFLEDRLANSLNLIRARTSGIDNWARNWGFDDGGIGGESAIKAVDDEPACPRSRFSGAWAWIALVPTRQLFLPAGRWIPRPA
eukprot:CAMPEP_0204527224 /NCGR_PEP_ID=MMETSP0661-20131031/8861_1 /ASSEMBLY_ACC=CAM_ASM_000606 /TAXON_ID=109239 /ORGANISM="Alexandrium margalefi, Strain AMGDE01CS-322" /LENGTH=275 /DNA_ID=CAMNT_0051533109 /DNA_START=45 /DNA_END=874 /DNA_ORIENTATION=-